MNLRMGKSKQNTTTIMQDKSKFITDILDYTIKKKVDDKTKERLINLISREFEKTGIVETEIIERLSKIEEMLSGNDKSQNEEKGFRGKLHKPEKTYLFLSNFSGNEGGLKNLTHPFNLDFIEYETFIQQCKNDFDESIKKYPNVPDALLTRIKEFAFSAEPRWYIRKGKEKIEPKLGWSEPNFIEWYKREKKHPWNNGKYKKEMITPFRESIRARSDSEALFKLINETFALVFGLDPICEIKLDEESLKHADFYTDVDNLGQAVFEIFSTIKDMSIKNFCNKIEVGFQIDGGYKMLSIKHIDSISTKWSDDKDFLGGNLRTIRSKLYGLCNYEIHAKFPNGYFRKIILSDNDSDKDKDLSSKHNWMGKSYPIDEDDVKGFTHVLKFY